MLIAVFNLTILVWQASFRVYELTGHGARVLALFLFCFAFPVELTNLTTDLAVKSTYAGRNMAIISIVDKQLIVVDRIQY